MADSTRPMSDVIDPDGFRANVGIVLMRDGDVFLGRRTGGKGWQFPQGGVRSGESLEQALFRELEEEIGVPQSAVQIVGQTERWLRYRLPPRYVRRNQQPLCTGQKQRWFLLRLQRGGAVRLRPHQRAGVRRVALGRPTGSRCARSSISSARCTSARSPSSPRSPSRAASSRRFRSGGRST